MSEPTGPITPTPKTIADLSSTLAARPTRRTSSVAAAAGGDRTGSEPASQDHRPNGGMEAGTADLAASDASKAPRPGDARRRPARRPRLTGHTVFYVPVDLGTRVRDFARQRDLTNAEVIFDAIEATQDQLPQLLAAPTTPSGPNRLFTRTEKRPVGKKVQISAAIGSANLQAIDQLVADLGADSRSQLIESALSAYLDAHAAAPASA